MSKCTQGAVALVIASFLLVGVISRRNAAPRSLSSITKDRPIDLGPMAESAVREDMKSPHEVTFPPGRIVLVTDRGFRVAGIVLEQDNDGIRNSYEYRVDFIKTTDGFEPETVTLTRSESFEGPREPANAH